MKSHLRHKVPSTRYSSYPEYRNARLEWLDLVPSDWTTARLRFMLRLNPSDGDHGILDPHLSVSFVPMDAVGEYGGLHLDAVRPLSEVREGFTYFQDGDVIVAKITPCFENGKGALAQGLENGVAFGTTELHVLRPGPEIDTRYLMYLTFSDHFRRLGAAEMYGAGGQKRVPEDFVRDLLHPAPPLDEQRAISAFLDLVTAKIDALVSEKKRLIGLLEEKRTALITRAMTQGLHSGVPKKHSGVEWLGEVPAHWRLTRLKYAASRIVDCPHETPIYSDDGEYYVIRTADLREGRLDLSAARRVGDDEFRRRIRRLQLVENDVVYSREGERFGHAALVPTGASVCLGQRMMQFRTLAGWCPRFLMWQLNSRHVYQQADLDTAGATSPHVNVETIRNFRLSEPPLVEQQAIGVFLDRETSRFDELITRIRDGLERVGEARTTLITAAVTGKIDTREETV